MNDKQKINKNEVSSMESVFGANDPMFQIPKKAESKMNLPELEKKIAQVYEKQIARAILDAQKMREESYHYDRNESEAGLTGEYKLDWETCFIEAAKKNKLSKSMWYLLSLANHWFNDIQLWAEDILAGKDCYTSGDHEPCCKDPSEEKCEQCQETGLADQNNDSAGKANPQNYC